MSWLSSPPPPELPCSGSGPPMRKSRRTVFIAFAVTFAFLLLISPFIFPSRTRTSPQLRPIPPEHSVDPEHPDRPPKALWTTPFDYPNLPVDSSAEWWTYAQQPLNWSVIMGSKRPEHFSVKPEVIPALRNSPPPSTYDCLTNLRPDSPRPLVYLGVFCTASDFEARAMIRMFRGFGMGSKSPKVVTRFIIGSGASDDAMQAVADEQKRYKDMVVLDQKENMNDGKTHAFFEYIATLKGDERPQFVFKTDTDTFVVMPNFLATLSVLDCSQSLYLGSSWGSWISDGYPLYFRGQLYGFSWPLAAWIGKTRLTADQTSWIEDLRTGTWLYSLPPSEPGYYVDYGAELGDFGGEINVHKIGRHAMKNSVDFMREAFRMEELFKKENKPFSWPP